MSLILNQLNRLNSVAKTLIWLLSAILILLFWQNQGVYRDDFLTMLSAIFLVFSFVTFFFFLFERLQAAYSTFLWSGLCIGIIFIALFISIYYIEQVPPPLFYDESHAPSKGLSLIDHSRAFWLLQPNLIPERVAVQGQSVEVLLGFWLKAVGVSFARSRLFWLLVAWSALPFIYLTAKNLFSHKAAIGAVGTMAVFPLFHNYIRPDSFVLPALSAGMYFYFLGEKTGKSWPYFFAGLMIGASLEAHNFSIRFILLFMAVISGKYLYKIWKSRSFVWDGKFFAYVLGNLCFAAFYLFFHVFLWGLSLGDYFTAGIGAYENESEIAGVIASNDFQGKINELGLFFQDYAQRHPVEFGFFLFLLVANIRRRESYIRLNIFMILASWFLLILILPKHNIYYYGNTFPFFALLAAAFLHRFMESSEVKSKLSASLFFFILTISGLQWIQSSIVSDYYDMGEDFIETSAEINAVLAPEIQVISAWQAYYFGLNQRTFIGSETFDYLSADEWPDVYGVPVPQAIILTPGLDHWFENLHMYIEEHGMVRTRCWYIRHFGFVSLYILPELAPPERDLYCGE